MKKIKRFLGMVWMILSPATIIYLLLMAAQNINTSGSGDINKPLPWIIIISIFTPIAVGFFVFGWYAWKGEFDKTSAK